jgi:hypothetical protein
MAVDRLRAAWWSRGTDEVLRVGLDSGLEEAVLTARRAGLLNELDVFLAVLVETAMTVLRPSTSAAAVPFMAIDTQGRPLEEHEIGLGSRHVIEAMAAAHSGRRDEVFSVARKIKVLPGRDRAEGVLLVFHLALFAAGEARKARADS